MRGGSCHLKHHKYTKAGLKSNSATISPVIENQSHTRCNQLLSTGQVPKCITKTGLESDDFFYTIILNLSFY